MRATEVVQQIHDTRILKQLLALAKAIAKNEADSHVVERPANGSDEAH